MKIIKIVVLWILVVGVLDCSSGHVVDVSKRTDGISLADRKDKAGK